MPVRYSMKVPRFLGMSKSAIKRRVLRNSLSLSSPRNAPIDEGATPALKATTPFSGKLKSKYSRASSPSCSFCLARSDPPTTPMVTFLRSSWRKFFMAGVITLRASVRVPSTSNKTRVSS
eukprot:33086_3